MKFSKEIIEQYGEEVYLCSKRRKTTIEKEALIMVYIAKMSGHIGIDDDDDFYDAIIKSAKNFGRK